MLSGHPLMISKAVFPDGRQAIQIPGPFPLFIQVMLNPAELYRVMRLKKLADRVNQVELTVGPIDSVLGQYNFALDTIDIDGLETILVNAAKDPRPEALDRAVTEVTAHEARHAWQQRHFGWWGRMDRIVIFLAVGGLSWWYFTWPMIHRGFELVKSGSSMGLLGFPLVVAGLIIWRSCLSFARIAAYRWSWAERDARAYAAKAADDPDWKEVINVDIGVPVPVRERINP